MPVYLVAEVKKKDKQKYNEYLAALTQIIEKHGGRYLVRGGRMTPLYKDWELDRRHVDKIVVVEFPSAADHRRCFTSPEYRAIVPLRDASAEVRAFLLEGYVPDERSEDPEKHEYDPPPASHTSYQQCQP
jgi:uncharacterized protein (DUF1330 family)